MDITTHKLLDADTALAAMDAIMVGDLDGDDLEDLIERALAGEINLVVGGADDLEDEEVM
jgi:hypothetical protein